MRNRMKTWRWVLYTVIGLLILAGIAFFTVDVEYAYNPPRDNIVEPTHGSNPVQMLQEKAQTQQKELQQVEQEETQQEESKQQNELNMSLPSYDVWGTHISKEEARELLQTQEGEAFLSPENGAVKIDEELLALGREAFYEETFGNEVFLTDIVGILDGALTLPNMVKAIVELGGEPTDNLQVELAETVTIGGKRFAKGEKIDTGLDVPRGAMTPLGMPVSVSGGQVRVGISCAACHATVDRESGKVLEGVPNSNLNAGMLIALSTNSAAYFSHADIEALQDYLTEQSATVQTANGGEAQLPDPAALEAAVDETFINWPAGYFDSTIDMVANPSQIPDSFTLGDHPYSWSGFAMAGPFRGLSVFNSNVHAQNSDTVALAKSSDALFEVDEEVFMGTLLQNAANPDFRYDPESGEKPSVFYESIDPTPGFEGVNENVHPPSFPNPTLMSPNGTIISSPGTHVAEQINAMSAFQNTLSPPQPNREFNAQQVEKGRKVFERAGCVSCHAGEAYTNHQIIPAEEIGTEPSRAKAFAVLEDMMEEPTIHAPSTPVPVPDDARVLEVPTDHLDQEQINLAFAHGGTDGGYKVKGLVGLYWTAPYLHDGGVAVGVDEQAELGVSETVMKGKKADPVNSLRAMVDRQLRYKVIQANRKSEALQHVHIQGIGHEYWVDEQAGFTQEDQEALVEYLLSLDTPPSTS